MAEARDGVRMAGLDVTPVILAVDDEPAVLASIGTHLARLGYDVVSAQDGAEALRMLDATRPDLVLLDADMPGLDGFGVSAAMQADESLADVPVVFLAAHGTPPERRKLFESGGVAYIEKPVTMKVLDRAVRENLRTTARWQARAPRSAPARATGTFAHFKNELVEALSLGEHAQEELDAVAIGDLYSIARFAGIHDAQLARLAGEYLGLGVVGSVDPDRTLTGILPLVYCRSNRVVPVEGTDGGVILVLANPFDQEVLDSVRHAVGGGRSVEVAVAAPGIIDDVLWPQAGGEGERRAVIRFDQKDGEAGRSPAGPSATAALMQNVLDTAVGMRASDVHIESKVGAAVVRVRVDGDMRELRSLGKDEARRLVSLFKVIGDMDIAEKRRPQDGGAEATVFGRAYKLRLATSATPHGESLVIRIVDPSARAEDLTVLGMSRKQETQTLALANRSQGLILVVGPTGSGKSTTVFSILSRVDSERRSLISVEDPVEYRIPFANQMQVNHRGGVTFDALLRSAIRQDPDILFLGEIRDLLSGKAALDFASSGHLTVSTLHSANATSAIFRLERLGLVRAALADGISGVIAQKLLKRLCEKCRRVRPITAEERAWLQPFAAETPEQVAEPVGCPACHGTGYRGREGVFEVLEFDPEVTAAVRAGMSVGEMRRMVQQRGDVLVGSHGVEKVRDLTFSARDVYEQVLLDERAVESAPPRAAARPDRAATDQPHLLLVEDDPTMQALLRKFLTQGGYAVTSAGDGAEALIHLDSHQFDAIISDIDMPTLDGMEFLEVLTQRGIEVPVVFVTGRNGSEIEARAFEMGAADFIRKPVRKDVLLARVARLAPHRAGATRDSGDD